MRQWKFQLRARAGTTTRRSSSIHTRTSGPASRLSVSGDDHVRMATHTTIALPHLSPKFLNGQLCHEPCTGSPRWATVAQVNGVKPSPTSELVILISSHETTIFQTGVTEATQPVCSWFEVANLDKTGVSIPLSSLRQSDPARRRTKREVCRPQPSTVYGVSQDLRLEALRN